MDVDVVKRESSVCDVGRSVLFLFLSFPLLQDSMLGGLQSLMQSQNAGARAVRVQKRGQTQVQAVQCELDIDVSSRAKDAISDGEACLVGSHQRVTIAK